MKCSTGSFHTTSYYFGTKIVCKAPPCYKIGRSAHLYRTTFKWENGAWCLGVCTHRHETQYRPRVNHETGQDKSATIDNSMKRVWNYCLSVWNRSTIISIRNVGTSLRLFHTICHVFHTFVKNSYHFPLFHTQMTCFYTSFRILIPIWYE
jgi:hypothetical protein